MKIAILGGTRSIGKGLALRWAGKHEVVVCSRDPDKSMKVAGKCYTLLSDKGRFCTGISGSMNEMGIKYADVVVLSVPYQGIVPLLKDLTPYFSDQIVISLVVPMKKSRWYEYAPPKHGSAALEIQDILPKSVKVVSAYHNVPARKLANIEIALDYDVVVCGDDANAKRTVMELTREINNLRPLDDGGLASTYMIESLTPFLINLAIRNGLSDIGVKRKGETKFIFFSGKGGVGKSTMSCATAVWLAKKDYKTLLVTTDPAPNLSDIFGQQIGHKITAINNVENLFSIEINPDTASEEYKERIVAPMRELLDEKNIQVIKEQLNSPCVEEVAAFDKFIEFMDDPQYDVVIFDTAPTGHTIRLLELPGGWSSTLETSASTCIGPGASLQSAKAKYEKAISYLQDDAKTSFIFVLKPENSSLLETKRSSDELSNLGIKINLLIINGILPEEVCTDEFFKTKKEDEQKVVQKINEEFPVMQKLYYPLRDSEVCGLESLKAAGDFLYEGIREDAKIESANVKIQETSQVKTDQNELYDLLTPLNGTRYIFFTGKGGVGKSTIACTTSIYLAEKGFRTLILTTDPASHLHDIFGQKIEHEPTKIKGVDNLFAARIDQKKALEEYKERIMEVLKDKDKDTRRSVEEDLNSPCAEEMAAFEKFINYFELKSYDIIIFDTAPTGHTLRLLELPSDWKGFIDIGDLTIETSDETKNKYSNVIETMRSKEKSTFVFVMYPEYTPMIEAWRASEELKRQVGIETALVAVNYILPRDFGRNLFFRNRRKQQEKYLIEIKQRFKIPMFVVPLLEKEPKGLDRLRELARTVFDS